ncbi:hypothetical protein ACFQL7_24195 [Halocatena marina]|uniref:Uncharacterized protein n=1 Tax=Halocatena marina TaxID=2934937 RepID=A0ABD5YUK3_9EURY
MINADETNFTSSTVSRRRVLQALGAATLPATGALAQPIRDTDAPAITWSRTYAPSAGRDSNSHVLTRTIVALDNGFMLAGVAGVSDLAGGSPVSILQAASGGSKLSALKRATS